MENREENDQEESGRRQSTVSVDPWYAFQLGTLVPSATSAPSWPATNDLDWFETLKF